MDVSIGKLVRNPLSPQRRGVGFLLPIIMGRPSKRQGKDKRDEKNRLDLIIADQSGKKSFGDWASF
jgi:hypothetical protein